MHSVRKPWWQQATALVTVTTGGVITGFNFVPGAAATMTSPTSVPLHLLALEQAAQPGAAMNARAVGGDSADSGTGDALLRSAIVNVAKYYLQIAATRSPAQMEALIWDNTSLNGADHGPSCAAFASLTLELAAQAVGQQSWVSGGTSYPFPLPAWADVRVDTNPASPAVTSVMADAQAHDRWHPVGGGYQPQPGDWVLFAHHVEVVTRYSGGVLDTIGADSDPGLTVNAHSYSGTPGGGRRGRLRRQRAPRRGLVRRRDGRAAAPRRRRALPLPPSTSRPEPSPSPVATPQARRAPRQRPTPAARQREAGAPRRRAAGQAVVPGIAQHGRDRRERATRRPRAAGRPRLAPQQQTGARREPCAEPTAARRADGRAHAPTAGAASGAAAVPGVVQPASATITAGSGRDGSGTQALDDRGHAAVIPGASAVAEPRRRAPSAGRRGRPRGEPGRGRPASHRRSARARPLRPPAASATPRPRPPPPPPGRPQHRAPRPRRRAAASSSATAKPEHYRQYAAAAQATPGTRTQQAFISLIAPGAIAAQQRWGVPAAVTIAQAIEESAWGNSQLAADYHNLFGIKGSGPAGSVGLPTSEFYNGQWVTIDAQFRVYHNVAESIADHAELLATSGYYQRAMADRAIPDAFANDLTGVYATDPDYGANLIAIMKLYNLYRFDQPAQSAAARRRRRPRPRHRRRLRPRRRPRRQRPRSRQSPSPRLPSQRSRARPLPPHRDLVGYRAAGKRSRERRRRRGAAAGRAGNRRAGGERAGGHPRYRFACARTRRRPGPRRCARRRPGAAGSGSAAAHPPAGQIPGVVAPAGITASPSAATPATAPAAAPAPPAATPAAAATAAATARTAANAAGAAIPGLMAPAAVNYQRQPAATATATTTARYQPEFTTAMTTAYFATAKGPLGHGEHLYRDVAGQTGIRWELLAACDWMQCKAHPRYSPVHGEKIGALNSDGTSYATKSAALGQCARDLIELAGAVYGIDLTARRLLSVRALADAFAAFRWGALLLRHGVSAMEFPYSVAGLTAQHQKMHWPVIDDPAAPDRPGARFREPFGAVPVVLSLDYPATVLTDRKRRQPRVPVLFLAPTPAQPRGRRPGRAAQLSW